MDNILINFTSGDTSGLTDASDGLDKIIEKNGEVGASWKKTSDTVQQSTKANTDTTNKLAQSIDQLAAASKTLDKSVVGGAYANYLKQIQTQLGLTQKELISYVQNARKAAQAEIFNPANSPEQIKALTLSISVMDDQLKQFGVTADGTTGASTRLTSQIREMKNQLILMKQSGQEGTQSFTDLQNKLVATERSVNDFNKEIKNASSDTRSIDGLVNAVSGVAGAYAVAQGAVALFGDENKDVAAALIKVQSAMAILQGLQEIGNVLQEKSSANLLLNNILRTKNAEAIAATAVATEANATATTLEATATGSATTAQIGLNAAMLASPVGILILSVGTLIGLYQIFERESQRAAEAQKALNFQMADAAKINDDFVSAIDQAGKEQLLQLQLLGKSQDEIRSKQNENLQDQINQQQNFVNAYKSQYEQASEVLRQVSEGRIKLNADEITGLEKTRDQYDALQKKLFDLLGQQRELNLSNALADNKQTLADVQANAQAKLSATIAGTDAERDAQIQGIKDVAAARENDVEFLSKTEAEKAAIRANDDKQVSALILQNYEHYLKGRSDLYAAYVAKAKLDILQNQTDSIESINKVTDAQIAAYKSQAKEALANPALNPGERAKIVAESNLQIAELEKQKQTDLLNSEKSGINARLVLTKAGTLEEYELKVQAIENEQKLELQAAQLTQDQIDEINANGIKKKQDAERAFTEAQLQQEIFRDDAELGRFKISEEDKLDLTLKRLGDQQAIEISQADGNAAQIAAINIKYDGLVRAAKIASIDAIYTKEIAAYQAYHDSVIKLDKSIADSNLDVNVKLSALEDLKREQENELQIEFNTLEKKKDLIEDYDVQYQLLLNKRLALSKNIEDQITKVEKEEIDKRIANMQGLIDFFQKGFQSFLPQDAFSVGLTSLQNFGTQAFAIFSKLKVQVADYNRIINDPDSSSGDKLLATVQKKIAQHQAIQAAEIAATQAAQDTINQIYADSAAQRQQQLQDQLAAFETERQAELDNQNLSKQQQANINERFDQKEKQAKIAAFKADQNAKKQQAIIDGLLAIAQTFARFGFPAGIPFAAAQAAATAVIVGKIASTPVPKFKHGVIDLKGPGTTTSDSIHAMLSKGESVIPAEPTSKWKDALVSIKDDKFEDYLHQKFKGFVFPELPGDVLPINNNGIDYDRLATAVATKMKGVIPGAKSMHFNIDKNGIHTIVLDGNSRTEFKNKRYSMT